MSEGFKLDTRLNRDPGDLGRGICLYPKKWLAKLTDECVLEVEVDVSDFFRLVPPKLDETLEELRRRFGYTIHEKGGKNIWGERLEASWE